MNMLSEIMFQFNYYNKIVIIYTSGACAYIEQETKCSSY